MKELLFWLECQDPLVFISALLKDPIYTYIKILLITCRWDGFLQSETSNSVGYSLGNDGILWIYVRSFCCRVFFLNYFSCITTLVVFSFFKKYHLLKLVVWLFSLRNWYMLHWLCILLTISLYDMSNNGPPQLSILYCSL